MDIYSGNIYRTPFQQIYFIWQYVYTFCPTLSTIQRSRVRKSPVRWIIQCSIYTDTCMYIKYKYLIHLIKSFPSLWLLPYLDTCPSQVISHHVTVNHVQLGGVTKKHNIHTTWIKRNITNKLLIIIKKFHLNCHEDYACLTQCYCLRNTSYLWLYQ